MKIVCDNCGAKYSIADEKIAGKVFRIRCKKCSSPIVVRGDISSSGASASAASSSFGSASQGASPYGASVGGSEAAPQESGGIWHVVINGDQQGPFTPEKILEMFTRNELDWDSYVWREGFDGWKHARDIEELVSLVPSQIPQKTDMEKSSSEQAGGASGRGQAKERASAVPSAQQPARGSKVQTLVAAASMSPTLETAQRLSYKDGADIFGQDENTEIGASPAGLLGGTGLSSGALGSTGAGGRPKEMSDSEESSSMTGARNENSVLFSLSNLQALATSPSARVTVGGSEGPKSVPPAGHATGEGSGLIDIRALANMTQSGSGHSQKQLDDILAIGSAGSPFTGGLGAPVLVPEQEEKSSNKLLIIAISVIGALVVGIGILVIVLLSKKDAPPVTPVGPGATPTAETPQPDPPVPAQGTTAPTQATQEPKTNSETVSESEPSPSSKRSNDSRGHSKPRRGDKTPAVAAPEPTKPPAKGSEDKSFSELLSDATNSKGAPKEKPVAENLPETPAKGDVLSALKSVKPDVAACGSGQSGKVETMISVSGSTGKVSGVSVSGKFAGTPVASCAVKAIKRAKFPKFKQSKFEIAFPFSL